MNITELDSKATLFSNALDPIFCDNLIKKLETKPWTKATIIGENGSQVLNENIRLCSRYMEIDHDFSEKVFEIIRDHLPNELCSLELRGLNPMFRYLRYEPGHYFNRHYDQEYTDANGNVSLMTVQIYLNDAFEGGETIFYQDDSYEIYRHCPKKGDILLFEQSLEHAGSIVRKGIKYAVRTDVMFSEKCF